MASSPRTRIIDVAQAAGIARSMAALALQGSLRLRPETVAAVRSAACRLRCGRSRRIGLLVREITNPCHAALRQRLIPERLRAYRAGSVLKRARTRTRLELANQHGETCLIGTRLLAWIA